MIQTDALRRIAKNNADAQRNPGATAYIIDSRERLVYGPTQKHNGHAIYIELNGTTRAIYRDSVDTTRTWGSDSIHTWLDAVHERLRA